MSNLSYCNSGKNFRFNQYEVDYDLCNCFTYMLALEVLSKNLKFGVHRIKNKMSKGKKAQEGYRN